MKSGGFLILYRRVLISLVAIGLIGLCMGAAYYFLYLKDGFAGWVAEYVEPPPLEGLAKVSFAENYCGAWAQPEMVSADLGEELAELSGLEVSSQLPDTVYQVVDSGNPAILYISNAIGKIRRRIRFAKAQVDVESLALGPCAGGQQCLFIADIGDNFYLRREKVIYFKEESKLFDLSEPFKVLKFFYPDGARLDAEALMVHPETGDLYLFSKGRKSYVFRIEKASLASHDRPVEAAFHMVLDEVRVTGADFSADGKSFTVTAGRVTTYLFDIDTVPHPLFSVGDDYQGVWSMVFPQMEAVAWVSDSKLLYGTEAKGGEPARLASTVCESRLNKELR